MEGAENYSHGIVLRSSKGADYVSTFTRKIAFQWNVSTYWIGSGTSLSTPTVAGVISSIILKIRQELNYTHGIMNGVLIDAPEKGIKITNLDIRDAINHTAVYWNTSDWSLYDWVFKWPYRNATFPLTGEPLPLWFKILMRWGTLTLPANPFAPWIQMGWGVVNESIVNITVDILMGREEMPEKPLEAVRYMQAVYKIREMIWKK